VKQEEREEEEKKVEEEEEEDQHRCEVVEPPADAESFVPHGKIRRTRRRRKMTTLS